MDDARTAWTDVAAKVESLGSKLKVHMEQEADDAVAERPEGTTQSAFDDLSSQVRDAFDAFGNAARDDAVHSDVRDIAELIKDALIETFRAAGAEMEGLLEQIEDYAEDAAERVAEAVGIDTDDDDDDDDDDGATGSVSDADAPIVLDSEHQDGAADA